MPSLDDYWYSQNPVAWVLLPVSWLFCAIASIRRLLYRSGIINSVTMPIPVIIVGNITVGGTGKTPLIIAMSKLLARQGIRAGIVSRGYGGNLSGEKIVEYHDSPAVVGDEPCLLKRRTGLPLAVGANRPAAASRLLDHEKCDVLLSDDGLQHYRLQRDLEIVVVDAYRRFGNGYCLPAGPLRETSGRLRQVDIVAWHQAAETGFDESEAFALKFEDAVNIVTGETRAIESFRETPVHAVAGIGHPARFFAQLEGVGLTLVEHHFPDHHSYTPADLSFKDENPVLMTEKDAVKCSDFACRHWWYVPVSAVLSVQLSEKITTEVSRLLHKGSDA